MAEWKFQIIGGLYLLQVEYASAEWRPVNIFVNGEEVAKNVLGTPTGCFLTQCQHKEPIVTVTMVNGENIVRIESSSIFPHIRTLFLDPVAPQVPITSLV
jgi:hypothetical protein